MTLSLPSAARPRATGVAAQQRIQYSVRLRDIGQNVGLAGVGDVSGKALSDFHGDAAQIAFDPYRRLNAKALVHGSSSRMSPALALKMRVVMPRTRSSKADRLRADSSASKTSSRALPALRWVSK